MFFMNFILLRIFLFKDTHVTTTTTGHQKRQKQHNEPCFCPKGKKSLDPMPPHELKVGPRSGPYFSNCMLNDEQNLNY